MIVTDLWSSRGESTTSKVDFHPGNMQERLANGNKTRKLSNRKDDRAMRPIYGCPENFESPDQPTATFPEICNGRLVQPILRTCVQNWKFVALPVPEIIGGYSKS